MCALLPAIARSNSQVLLFECFEEASPYTREGCAWRVGLRCGVENVGVHESNACRGLLDPPVEADACFGVLVDLHELGGLKKASRTGFGAIDPRAACRSATTTRRRRTSPCTRTRCRASGRSRSTRAVRRPCWTTRTS